jgi:hypothetical protein
MVALPGEEGPDYGVMLFGGELELSSTLGISYKDSWALGIFGDEAVPSAHFYFQDVEQYPETRTESAAVYLTHRNSWLIFAGLSSGRGLLQDTWALAYNSTQSEGRPLWTRVINAYADGSRQQQPQPRSGHAMAAVTMPVGSPYPRDDYVVVVGGRQSLAGFVPLGDTWLFNVTSSVWSVLNSSSPTAPTARAFHVASPLGPGAFVMYGGQLASTPSGDAVFSSEAWVCNLDTRLTQCDWKAVADHSGSSLTPPGRSHHVATVMACALDLCQPQASDSQALCVFGGLLGMGSGIAEAHVSATSGGLRLGNDTWVLLFRASTGVGVWQEVRFNRQSIGARAAHGPYALMFSAAVVLQIKTKVAPPPRWQAASVAFGPCKLIVSGGFGNAAILSDTWILGKDGWQG